MIKEQAVEFPAGNFLGVYGREKVQAAAFWKSFPQETFPEASSCEPKSGSSLNPDKVPCRSTRSV